MNNKRKIENYFHLHSGYAAIYFPENELYIKPILRPLFSITENEAREFCVISEWTTWEDMPFDNSFELWKKDLLGNIQCNPEAFRFLIYKHFDLFHLIENGLAYDSTKLEWDNK